MLQVVGADMDWADRANGFWTVLLLAALSVASYMARVHFEPPTCWLPPQFTASHAFYAHRTAGLQTSYLLNTGREIPLDRKDFLTPSYHLYVPLILFFQAVGFLVPFVLWRVLRRRLALDLTSTSASLTTALATGTSGSNAMVRQTASLLLESVSGSKFLLTAGYLGVKCLCLVNVLAQCIALSVLFHKRLGFTTGDSPELSFFPIKVHHFFSIQQLQSVQVYTVQCSLVINDTYIRMFVFLWYWMVLLALITLVNTVISVLALLLPAFRDGAVVTFVRAGDFQAPPGRPEEQGPHAPAAAGGKPSSGLVKQWISSALGSDGVLLLSLLSSSAGPHLAARLAQEMWFLTHQGPVGAAAPPPAYAHGPYPSTQGPHSGGQLYPSMPQGVTSAPGHQGYPQRPQAQGAGSRGKGEEGNDLELKPLM